MWIKTTGPPNERVIPNALNGKVMNGSYGIGTTSTVQEWELNNRIPIA